MQTSSSGLQPIETTSGLDQAPGGIYPHAIYCWARVGDPQQFRCLIRVQLSPEVCEQQRVQFTVSRLRRNGPGDGLQVTTDSASAAPAGRALGGMVGSACV